jgi:outer membrane protein, multidrug efflux system
MMPPMRRMVSFALVFLAALDGRGAFAQPAQPPGSTPTTATGQLPPAPTVDDPMLKPLPRPKIEITTWDDALQYIRARSTDLRVAAAQVEQAEAQSRIALAAALPTINGTSTFTHNIITNDTLQPARAGDQIVFRPVSTPFPNFLTAGLTASQPLLALRAWYAIGTAHRSEHVAELNQQDVKRVISLNVANAIVAVVTAERVSELNRVGLLNALTRLELTTRRTTLGSGTGLDVIRGRQDVETARATLVAGDESLRQAREALGLALGTPEQVGVPSTVDLNGLEASARNSCQPGGKVEDRADIAALQGKVEVAHRGINDAKLQFAPTVDLRSTVGTTTVDTGAAPNTTWNIQAVLTVPIWDGGVRYGNLRNARALETIAGQNLETARRNATIEVERARRSVGVAEDRRKVAAQTRDLAAENDRLTRTAYLEGRGTSLELVTAAQALREAEIQLALRDFELVRARVAAVLALAICPW